MKGEGCSKGIGQIYPHDILTKKGGKTRIKGGHPLEIKKGSTRFSGITAGRAVSAKPIAETRDETRSSRVITGGPGLLFLAHLIVSGPGYFPRLALAVALAFLLDLSHVEAIAGDRGRVERQRRSKSGKNDQRYVTAPHGPAVDQLGNRSTQPLTSSSNSGNAETKSTTKALSASASRLAAARTRLIHYRRS